MGGTAHQVAFCAGMQGGGLGGGKCQYGGGFAQLEGSKVVGRAAPSQAGEPFGFCPRAVQPCFEAVVAVVEVVVDFGVDDVGEADDAEAAVDYARADADLQEDKACFDALDVVGKLFGRGDDVFVGDKYVFEIQAEGARTFEGAKFGAVLQAYAFPLSACDEHNVAVADLGGIRPDVVFTDVGHPRQRAVDCVAAFHAFGLEVVFFDVGKVFDGIGHARTRQYFALQDVGKVFVFDGPVGRLVQIPRASRLTPRTERGCAAFFADFAQYGDLRCQTQAVAAFGFCTDCAESTDCAEFAHKCFGVVSFAVDVVHYGFELGFDEFGNVGNQGLGVHLCSLRFAGKSGARLMRGCFPAA
ncbi:Uncharacterised protein [Neisseria meningitidis]|nr:Uncharacterised protein [Neisseria meningitidis]CWS82144.1 Uncharacterised protein [Neisseria meningitidis]